MPATAVDVGPSPGPRYRPAQQRVIDLLGRSDDELLARHGRWYVPRREARYLRRNALVVLGNAAAPDSAAAAEALRRALAHDDPIVRGHAVWAARRLGRDDLVEPLADDSDPLVRAELDAAVEPRHLAGVGVRVTRSAG